MDPKTSSDQSELQFIWAVSLCFFVLAALGLYYYSGVIDYILPQMPVISTPQNVPVVIPVAEPVPAPIRVLPSFTAPNFTDTTITMTDRSVVAASPKIFAYAHGTVAVDNKIFIGMADRAGNTFDTHALYVFTDPSDLNAYKKIELPRRGDVETMVYDQWNKKIYFALTENNDLELYSLDPQSYDVKTIISTSTLYLGVKPAITTDGGYIYGITNTDPSTVFKVRISDGALMFSSGHIPFGHSAAIGRFARGSELYFGGGMGNGFEKVRASDLASMQTISLAPCTVTDDMPFVSTGENEGDVYVGCETEPYGYKIHSTDLSRTPFSLPKSSLGMYVFGNDIYNASQGGTIDMFPGMNMRNLHRYSIVDHKGLIDTHGQEVAPNELFYMPSTGAIYFTAWWSVPGLYELASSTVSASSATTTGQ